MSPRAIGLRVHDWWLGPAPLQPMVAARIVLGFALLACHLIRLPMIVELFGSGSVAWFPPYRTFLLHFASHPLSSVIEVVGAWSEGWRSVLLWVGYPLLLLSAASFLVGYRARTAGFIALFLHLFFHNLHPLAMWGSGRMFVPFLLYVVCSDAGRHLSVESWRRRRSGAPDAPWLSSAWTLRLLQLHVVAMYAVTGLSRLGDDGWHSGTMLYAALTDAHFARLDLDWSQYLPVLKWLSWSVFLLEPGAVVALWIPFLRRWTALALIAMHLGLELLVRVDWWNYVMVAGLIGFLPAAWLAWAVGGEERRRPAAPASPAAS